MKIDILRVDLRRLCCSGNFSVPGFGPKVRDTAQESESQPKSQSYSRMDRPKQEVSELGFGGSAEEGQRINDVQTRGIVKTSGFTRGVCKNQ